MIAELPVPLTALEAGAVARLAQTRLDEDTRSLLRSLGMTDDSELRVCKSGDPVIIQVRATRIGVSIGVARGIFVTVPRVGAEVRDDARHRAHV